MARKMILKVVFVILCWYFGLNEAELSTESEQYIGCYQDPWEQHPAMGKPIESNNRKQTIEHCLNVCANQTTKYAGLQNGTDCSCSNNFTRSSFFRAKGSGCNVKCSGSQSQTCGGMSHNSVYTVCSKNCAKTTCSKERKCDGCKPGYMGAKCEGKCTKNCLYKKCDQMTGACIYCRADTTDKSCTTQCNANCEWNCEQVSGKCQSCKEGYWGEKCKDECNETCKDCNQKAGKCKSCKSSYWGNNCDKLCSPNCIGNCDQDNGNCLECKAPWYGFRCEKQCPQNCNDTGCNKKSGVCHSCQPGYYGSNCTLDCTNCKDNVCNQNDGSCAGCTSGYYGAMCELQCDTNCMDGLCEKANGTCSKGCINGFFSTNCSVPCPDTCNTGCQQHSGWCIEGCKDGSFGHLCHKACPNNCEGSKCNQSSGSCPRGCKDGYFGAACNISCPTNCLRKCDNQGGTCSSGCVDGHYGTNCERACPVKCAGKKCRQTDGSCTSGCQAGWMGDKCSDECQDGRFGEKCAETCHCAETAPCNAVSGRCDNGCAQGWTGPTCNQAAGTTTTTTTTECQADRFGEQCAETCHCAETAPCDAVSGQCDNGCAQGWTGPACNQAAGTTTTTTTATTTTTTTTSDGSSAVLTGVIAIAASGAALLVLLPAIIVIILFRRCRNGKRNKGERMEMRTLENSLYNLQPGTSTAHSQPLPPSTGPRYVDHNAVVQATSQSRIHASLQSLLSLQSEIGLGEPIEFEYEVVEVSAVHKVHKDELKQHIENGNLVKEYQMLPTGQKLPWTVAAKAYNRNKNRYRGISAYDHSRVVLSPVDDDPTSDYINACYVPGFHRGKAYIAAQGVFPNTLVDMWRMVWQVGAKVIVITTNLKEGEKVKCIQYWPDIGSNTYGEVTVDMPEEHIMKDYVIRKFIVQKQGETRVIHQFHFTVWPDHGVPESAVSLINFRHLVRKHMQATLATDGNDDAPIIVHCSAGIGRTGTYIALDCLLEQAEHQDWLDVPACLTKLRQARINMVQNLGQYLFLYQAVFDGIFVGYTLVTRDDLRDYSRAKVESQHRMLLEADDGDMKLLCSPDTQWVIKSTQLTPNLPETTMICCSAPASDNATELWERVAREKCQLIVLVVDEHEMEEQTWQQLLPKQDTPIRLSSGLEVHEVYREEGYELTSVHVKLDEPYHEYVNTAFMKGGSAAMYENLEIVDKGHECHVLVVSDRSSASFIEAWKRMPPSAQMSIFGSTKESSGVFAVCMALCDQLEAFDEVDVFNAVRKLQKLNPGLIEDVEDYQLLYMVLQNVPEEQAYSL